MHHIKKQGRLLFEKKKKSDLDGAVEALFQARSPVGCEAVDIPMEDLVGHADLHRELAGITRPVVAPVFVLSSQAKKRKTQNRRVRVAEEDRMANVNARTQRGNEGLTTWWGGGGDHV